MLALPAEVIALLNEGRFSLRWMVRFDIDFNPQGLWNDTYAVTFDGVTYQPTAGNMQLDPVSSSSDLDADQIKITLSGLLPAVTGILDGVDWHQRPVTVYLAFLNEAGEVLHVLPRFSGFMDAISIQDSTDGLSSIELMVESNNRELSRSSGRVRSDGDQRAVDPSDGFFKFATAASVDSQITWGRKGPQYPVKPR